MSKVYEALKRAAEKQQRAAQERKSPEASSATDAAATVPPPPSPSPMSTYQQNGHHEERREGAVTASLRKAAQQSSPSANAGAPPAAGAANGTNGGSHGHQHLADIPEALLRPSGVFRAPGGGSGGDSDVEAARNVEPSVVWPHGANNADPTLSGPVEIIQGLPGASPAGHSRSAFTEHTDVAATVGSALSGGLASRVAGATVNAVGSTRVKDYPSLEVDPARVEPHLVALTQPRSAHAERYRSLRTRVLHAGEHHKMQALVVTSAGVMEGKTVTALNLAWLLAQTDGVRAILVDGDLRHPCSGEYLDIEAPVGLSEILAGEAKLDDTIVRLEPAGLYLLPGGHSRDNVAEALSGPKFLAVLAELRRSFNYIIIDAPPLGIFTDATVLINRADSALIVVRSGRTRFAALDRVLEPLPRERILGVVLNASDEVPDESNYYYQRRRSGQGDTPAKDAGDAPETIADVPAAAAAGDNGEGVGG